MVKARLLEFQCPEVLLSLKGKAYLKVVGGVTPDQGEWENHSQGEGG
jgi:hypothetical protein